MSNSGDTSLNNEYGDSRKKNADTQRGCKDGGGDQVQNGLGEKQIVIASETILQSAHDCHGAYAEYQGGGDKSLRQRGTPITLLLESVLQFLSKAIEAPIQVQKLAQNSAHYHGDDRDEGVGAAAQTGQTNV